MSVKFICLFIINILCILQIDSSGDLKQDSKFDFEKQLFEKVLKMDSKMDTWEINLSKNNDDVKSALEKFEKMTKEISDVKNSMSELKQQFNIMIQDSKDKFENVIDDVRKEKDRMLQIVREETSNTISTFKKEEGRLINKSKERMHNYRNDMDNLMIELRTESEEINSITKFNVSSALSHVIHEAKNTLHHNKRHMDNIIKEMRQEAGIVLGNIKADVSDIMTQVEKETQKMINSTKTANGLYYPCNSSLDCKHPLGCHCGMCKCESGKDSNGQLCITKKKHKEICNDNCECSERLVCNNGLCSCEEIEYWDGNKCLARKTHQEECISSKECNETLACSNGLCKCNTIEYWDGNRCLARNEYIHAVSSRGHHKLLVVLTHQNGSDFYAQYSKFLVNDEHSKYLLKVTGYSGTAGDSLDWVGYNVRANGQMFTTSDRDNDGYGGNNCAKDYNSGWWYANCFYANLNRWPGDWYVNLYRDTIKSSYMMITKT